MANWQFIVESWRGGAHLGSQTQSFSCPPDKVGAGVQGIVEEWAKTAEKNDRVTVSVRRAL